MLAKMPYRKWGKELERVAAGLIEELELRNSRPLDPHEDLCQRFAHSSPTFIAELRKKRPYYLAFLNYPESTECTQRFERNQVGVQCHRLWKSKRKSWLKQYACRLRSAEFDVTRPIDPRDTRLK